MRAILSKIFIFILFLFSTIYFLSSAIPSFAESSVNKPANTTTFSNINSEVPNSLHNWTQTVMLEVMSSLSCQLTGIDPATPNKQCLGVNQKTGKIGFLPAGDPKKQQLGGAIGGMSNMISMLYAPPLHTSDYFKNLAQNFGITKKTYAQTSGGGRGFGELSPLMNIWKVFRDIVYSLMVIIMVVVGLAIMLRLNIDPRTVMSVQNQIPKIIIGIFLITFSFAIAGFLVDLMWVSTYTVANTFSSSSQQTSAGALISGKTPFEVIDFYGGLDKITGEVATSGRTLFKKMLGIHDEIYHYISPFSLIQDVTSLSSDPAKIQDVGLHPENALKDNTQEIQDHLNQELQTSPVDFIIDLISHGAAAYTFYKVFPALATNLFNISGTFFTLVSASSDIVGKLIAAAFAIPISGVVYAGAELFLREGLPWLLIWIIVTVALLVALVRLWFALIMAYVMILIDVVLAPFWIIAGFIPGSSISFSAWLRDIAANLLAFPAVIFMFLLGKTFMDGFGQGGFMPPLIGGISGDEKTFGPIIAIGIILITPNVVNMLKQALKAPKMETGVGKAVMAAPNIVQGAFGTAMQALGVRYQLSMLKNTGSRGAVETASHGQANPPGAQGGTSSTS